MKFYLPLVLALSATSAVFAQEDINIIDDSAVVDGTTVIENEPTTTFRSTTVVIGDGETSTADVSTSVVTETVDATAVVPATTTATLTTTDVVILPTTVVTSQVTNIVDTTTATRTATDEAVATVIVTTNHTEEVDDLNVEEIEFENGSGKAIINAALPMAAAGVAAMFML